MCPASQKVRSGKRARRALAMLIVSLTALAAGALAALGIWTWNSQKEPERLDLLFAAWNEFNAQRYDQASAILERRAAMLKPTALDWMLRARIAESRGRLVEALDDLKQIPDRDPVSSQAWLKTGQIELARHNARGAEMAFKKALELNADQMQAYRELAYLYAVQCRRDDCDAQFRAVARRIPMDHTLAFAWSQNFVRIWDPKEGCGVLQGFVEFDPSDRFSRLALAANLQLANRLDEAKDVLGRLPDSDADARALRAQIAIDQGEIAAATSLARDGPADHVRLNVLRGHLALNAGEADKAAQYYRAALGQDPDDRDSNHGLGQALKRVGDPRADQFLRIAHRYDAFRRDVFASVVMIHYDPGLFSKLGEHCEANRLVDQARVWYQLAIKRDPLNVPAHQALVRLDQVALGSTAPQVIDVPVENRQH